MKPIETEIEELRARVARLEVEVARLSGRVPGQGAASPPSRPPPIQSIGAAPSGAEPPMILTPSPVTHGATGSRLRLAELPSTVWIAAAGAFIFLLGAIYGLTVSIERGWISPPVRVSAGLVLSLGAGVWAARLLFGARRSMGVTLLAVAAGTWTFSLYFGAREAALFPLWLGFVGATLATVLAGGIGARVQSDGALAVGIATGLVAPLAFSSGSGTVAGLALYLGMLVAGQLLVSYTTRTGGDWRISRVLGLAGVWLVALAGATEANLGDANIAIGALWLLAGTTLMLAWLPRQDRTPIWPTMGSVVTCVALGLACWAIWERAGWTREFFAIVLVAEAAMVLGLLVGARRRTHSNRHDMMLLLLAAGFGLLAVPVAISWRWTAATWGLGALLLAIAVRRAVRAERPEAAALRVVSLVSAGFASLVWLLLALFEGHRDAIFLNPIFFAGATTAAAWAVLLAVTERQRAPVLSMLQIVAVNAIAWEFAAAVPTVHGEQASLPLGALLATFVYAAAGAGQWLRGVLYEALPERAKAFRVVGYGWLAVAALKLLVSDLANTDLVFRACAALGVGAVFIGAALWADRHRA